MVNPMKRAANIRIAVSQWKIRLSAVNFCGCATAAAPVLTLGRALRAVAKMIAATGRAADAKAGMPPMSRKTKVLV
jgi:hypothetical protein